MSVYIMVLIIKSVEIISCRKRLNLYRTKSYICTQCTVVIIDAKLTSKIIPVDLCGSNNFNDDNDPTLNSKINNYLNLLGNNHPNNIDNNVSVAVASVYGYTAVST